MRIKAREIETWSAEMNSQGLLPLVIRWLIRGSTEPGDIILIDFPAEDSVQRHGADGRLHCKKGNTYAVAGHSIWEVTNEAGDLTRKKGKADRDFETRTAHPVGYDPCDSTFVFLTGRRCNGKHEWQARKKREQKRIRNKKKIWKDIKCYDCDDIEQWMELAPAMAVRIAIDIFKIFPDGVYSLEKASQLWCYNKECEFTEKLLLAERDAEVAIVKDWLKGDPSKMKITATSKEEPIAFLWAVIQDMSFEMQERLYTKTLVVHDSNHFISLAETLTNQVFVYAGEDTPVNYVSKKHHVLLPIQGNINKKRTTDRELILKPLSRESFLKSFSWEKGGKDFATLEKLYDKCGGDLGRLKKFLT